MAGLLPPPPSRFFFNTTHRCTPSCSWNRIIHFPDGKVLFEFPSCPAVLANYLHPAIVELGYLFANHPLSPYHSTGSS